MEFLLGLHSGVRWIVVAITLVAAIWFLLTWLGRVANPRVDRILMLLFTIGLDIQVMLGIIYLIANIVKTQFEGIMAVHATVMIIALGVAHMVSARWKKAEPKIRARSYLIGIIVVMVLIFIGVSLLPEGVALWSFGG